MTAAVSLTWSTILDERTCLPYTITSGPRQRSHSLVRVPRDQNVRIHEFILFYGVETGGNRYSGSSGNTVRKIQPNETETEV
jgi:hypothetical protein